MEDITNQESESGNPQTGIPQITSESINSLRVSAQWAKFLAIIGFVGTGFLFLVGLVLIGFSGYLAENMNSVLPFKPSLFSLIYFILGAVCVIPVILLNNFSNQTLKAIRYSDTEVMNMAFMNLRRMFVYLGISTIVVLSLYVLAIIGMVIGLVVLAR